MIKGQKRLLLILAMLGDLFEDLADAGGLMSFSYQQVYGYVPQKYKKHNFETTIRKALKVGDINREIKEGQPHLKLTSRGKSKLTEYFPLFKFQKKKWDQKWRVIFFDIEEKNRGLRDRFREKLCELGFGKLQKSVYISPFSIEREMREFINALGLKGKTYLLVSTKFITGDERGLAQKIWDLDRINKEYRKILGRLEKKEIDKKELKKIKSLYLEALSIDPFLPIELLPEDWLREKVEREIRKKSQQV
ncbi:hypothetical protein ISS85_03790 [Candidatus Microgenomates bacterium]|nr:hypothetical protein [Candidatus Microgenomates bacterium]